jgi:hypothetical protein
MNRKQFAAVSAVGIVLVIACNAPFLATPTPIPTPTPTATVAPTPTPPPVQIASGTLDIPQTYMADLDTGIVPKDAKNPAFADVDLWFNAVSPTERYLEPYNGASLMVVGLSAVGYAECRNLQAAVARVDINSLPSGTYLCVTTNLKNTAVLRVNAIDYSSPGTMHLAFMTWHQP